MNTIKRLVLFGLFIGGCELYAASGWGFSDVDPIVARRQEWERLGIDKDTIFLNSLLMDPLNTKYISKNADSKHFNLDYAFSDYKVNGANALDHWLEGLERQYFSRNLLSTDPFSAFQALVDKGAQVFSPAHSLVMIPGMHKRDDLPVIKDGRQFYVSTPQFFIEKIEGLKKKYSKVLQKEALQGLSKIEEFIRSQKGVTVDEARALEMKSRSLPEERIIVKDDHGCAPDAVKTLWQSPYNLQAVRAVLKSSKAGGLGSAALSDFLKDLREYETKTFPGQPVDFFPVAMLKALAEAGLDPFNDTVVEGMETYQGGVGERTFTMHMPSLYGQLTTMLAQRNLDQNTKHKYQEAKDYLDTLQEGRRRQEEAAHQSMLQVQAEQKKQEELESRRRLELQRVQEEDARRRQAELERQRQVQIQQTLSSSKPTSAHQSNPTPQKLTTRTNAAAQARAEQARKQREEAEKKEAVKAGRSTGTTVNTTTRKAGPVSLPSAQKNIVATRPASSAAAVLPSRGLRAAASEVERPILPAVAAAVALGGGQEKDSKKSSDRSEKHELDDAKYVPEAVPVLDDEESQVATAAVSEPGAANASEAVRKALEQQIMSALARTFDALVAESGKAGKDVSTDKGAQELIRAQLIETLRAAVQRLDQPGQLPDLFAGISRNNLIDSRDDEIIILDDED